MYLQVGYSTPSSTIYVGDYYYGLDITTIRWTRYTYGEYPVGNVIGIMDIKLRGPGQAGTKFFTKYPLLTFLIYKLVSGTTYNAYILSECIYTQDFKDTTPAVYPSWFYETGYTPNREGEIYTFGPLKLRIISEGTGVITVQKAKLDGAAYTTIATINTTINPGKYYSININEVCEKIRLRISGTSCTFLQSMILHAIEKSKDRPRV
jgi:hypothetical protein